jgi:hypothetical protein
MCVVVNAFHAMPNGGLCASRRVRRINGTRWLIVS